MARSAAGQPATVRRRLSTAERERHIVREAIAFFAERGFGAQTRDLAERIGVTQPLLYRYFPTKRHLIDRVYEEVFLSRWKDDWIDLLADRSMSREDRLVAFYRDYLHTILTPDWVRIYLHSGLRGEPINRRYSALVDEKLIGPIGHAMFDLGPDEPVDGLARELVWNLHGGLAYRAIREYAYGAGVEADLDDVIRVAVATAIGGAVSAQQDE